MYCVVLEKTDGSDERKFRCLASQSVTGGEDVSVGRRWIHFNDLSSYGLRVVMRVPIDYPHDALGYKESARELE